MREILHPALSQPHRREHAPIRRHSPERTSLRTYLDEAHAGRGLGYEEDTPQAE